LNLVSPRADLIESLVFDSQGDKVNLQDVASMELSPLDLLEEHWGVVLMQVQANLPDSLPGQNVTFILFGDVQIENAVGTPIEIEAALLSPANIRVAPGETRPVLSSLTTGAIVIANGKAITATGELWVRVNHDPDEEIYGWIRADLLELTVDSLPDVEPSNQAINPMQAFYFKTGLGAPQCVEAPADGMLIQTPNGASKVNFTVNGMDVALGSTAYLTAPVADDKSCLYLIEGESDITSDGKTVTLQAGERTCVVLDEDGIAAGEPSEPEPYDAAFVQLVAPVLELLPEEIELPEARPTLTPTFTPTHTNVPVIIPRNTSTPTPEPTSTPTDFVFPTNTPISTATFTPTPLPPCPVTTPTTPCLPVAGFTHFIEAAISDRTVQFNNTSYGNITGVTWHFGDGNTSNATSPQYTYAQYGSYNVRLRVDNPYGFARINATITLVDQGLTPPSALFTYTVEIFEVAYQDSSTAGSAPITSWDWVFGDGTSGNGSNGVHVYVPGTYNLSLTVTDSNGLSDTHTSSVNLPPCSFSVTNNTTLTVNRNAADPNSTVYEVYLKTTDCSSGAPNGILSISNPTYSTAIRVGQHFSIVQTQPCTTTLQDGVAGTTPINITASDTC
jgi:PKD repeat protein